MPGRGLELLDRATALTSGTVSLSVGTRSDVHGAAWAAHARWLLGHDADALAGSLGAIRLARAIGHPYSLAVALAYGGVTHQMRHDVPAMTACLRELGELCDRYELGYYPSWVLILGGWARAGEAGIQQARRGISSLRAAGSFTRMPYWLSLLADLQARAGHADAAQATLDAAVTAARAHDDLWWLPEVMRMRAAFQDGAAAVDALRAAADLAAAHGSIALLRRCEQDLDGRRTLCERSRP
jgi:predicted ATPase